MLHDRDSQWWQDDIEEKCWGIRWKLSFNLGKVSQGGKQRYEITPNLSEKVHSAI